MLVVAVVVVGEVVLLLGDLLLVVLGRGDTGAGLVVGLFDQRMPNVLC